MAHTAFVDGVTIVSAAWLNAMNTHVHDGIDDDGHAPKIDIFDHATYGTNGVFEKILDTPTNYALQLRNNSNDPTQAAILLPTTIVNGGGLQVLGGGLSVQGNTFTSGKFQFSGGPGTIDVDAQSVVWTKGKILWTTAGAVSKFHSKNFENPVLSGFVVTVPFTDTLDYPPNISIQIEFGGTLSGGQHYEAMLLTTADPLNELKFQVLKVTNTTSFLSDVSAPLEDLIFNIIVS